jgi:Flp pilus assembly protein TadD
MADLKEALKVEPNMPNNTKVLNEIANMEMSFGDYNGAKTDFWKAIQIDPNNAEAYYGRGIAKYKLGDKSGACLDLRKAGELGYEKAYEAIKKYCK